MRYCLLGKEKNKEEKEKGREEKKVEVQKEKVIKSRNYLLCSLCVCDVTSVFVCWLLSEAFYEAMFTRQPERPRVLLLQLVRHHLVRLPFAHLWKISKQVGKLQNNNCKDVPFWLTSEAQRVRLSLRSCMISVESL